MIENPKVGESVRLVSNIDRWMTVVEVRLDGYLLCGWFTDVGEYHEATLPTAALAYPVVFVRHTTPDLKETP